MGLFSPKWKSKDWHKRLEGIKELDPLNIENQQTLVEIAKNNTDMAVREAAIKKVTDQNVLANIVKNERNPGRFGIDLRKTALERLTDQKLLVEVLKNVDNLSESKSVVERLSDQAIIAEIAKSAKDINMRWAAIKKLTDKMILADIAQEDDNYSIRQGVYKIIGLNNSQAALCDIALNEYNDRMRDEAMAKITDQNILAVLAKNADAWFIRKAAVEKLTDQTLLTVIAKTDKDVSVQIAASHKLSDLSQKTENLVRLFNSNFQEREKVVNELKELFSNNRLSLNDKAKILQLQGQAITKHIDKTSYQDFVCGGVAAGTMYKDKPATFFNI